MFKLFKGYQYRSPFFKYDPVEITQITNPADINEDDLRTLKILRELEELNRQREENYKTMNRLENERKEAMKDGQIILEETCRLMRLLGL